ncbi:MAG: hypothetical protein Q8858_16420, partial [Bacteroidota bacterium]|nr:hypothetical protein [Bacteroidota bacterium]
QQDEKLEILLIKKGEVYSNAYSTAIVFNESLARILLGRLKSDSITISGQNKQKKILKEIITQKDSLISVLNLMISSRDSAYLRLKDLSSKVSGVASFSVENTNSALKYATKVKLVSYLSCSACGAIAGAIYNNSLNRSQAAGAIVGAFIGVGINLLIQEILIGG